MKLVQRFREWLGLRACANHRHAPLEWFRADERPVPITNAAMEMMFAVGFGCVMRYSGFCPRCGRAIAWSSHDPRTPAQRRAQRTARKSRPLSSFPTVSTR